MYEANWDEVLQVFYEKELVIDSLSLDDDLDEEIFAGHEGIDYISAETGLNPDSVWNELTFLWEIGLIDHVEDRPDSVIGLTEKGFDVAHERELNDKEHNLSEKSARLSSYLVLAVVVQALAMATQQDNVYTPILSIIILFITLMVWGEIGNPRETLNRYKGYLPGVSSSA
jgi:hypothetical protein